jgi:hypothetical protein
LRLSLDEFLQAEAMRLVPWTQVGFQEKTHDRCSTYQVPGYQNQARPGNPKQCASGNFWKMD